MPTMSSEVLLARTRPPHTPSTCRRVPSATRPGAVVQQEHAEQLRHLQHPLVRWCRGAVRRQAQAYANPHLPVRAPATSPLHCACRGQPNDRPPVRHQPHARGCACRSLCAPSAHALAAACRATGQTGDNWNKGNNGRTTDWRMLFEGDAEGAKKLEVSCLVAALPHLAHHCPQL